MLSMTGQILPLPAEVAAQVKSSASINSLDSVVVGLVENSLDARACKIDVSVDFRRGTCTVEDDGRGISPLEFSEDGGLGKPYHTSKQDSLDITHGGDGTFISSLAALSILTITSHHYAHRSHASLILHHSRPAARLLPAPARHHLCSREHGTRVIVQDLFGNIPVRVKQRAATYDGREQEKQWDALSKKVVGVLLSWDTPIIFTLKGAESPNKLIIRGREGLSSSSAQDMISPKSLNLSLLRSILSQAGYIQPPDWHEWVKTSVRTSSVTIYGAISLKPAPSRNVQFISIGIRCLNVETHSVLFDQVNQRFALSDFGKLEDVSGIGTSTEKRARKGKLYKQNEFTNKQLKGGGKGVDKWPMFYICINLEDCPNWLKGRNMEYLESENALSSVNNALEAMVTGFLSDHHFRPRVRRSKSRKVEANRSACSKSPPVSKPQTRSPTKIKLTGLSQLLSHNAVGILTSNLQSPEVELLSIEQKHGKQNMELSPRISADILSSNIRFPIFHRGDNYEEAGFGTRSGIKGERQQSPRKLLSLGFPKSSRRLLPQGQTLSISKIASRQVMNHAQESSRAAMDVTVTDEALETTHNTCRMETEIALATSLSVSPKTEKNSEVTDEIIAWINPVSGATTHVSLRTGLVIRQPLEATERGTSNPSTSKPIVKKARLTHSASNPLIAPKTGSWASELIKNWDNPVFSPTEEGVSRISLEGPSAEGSSILQGRYHRYSNAQIQKAFSESYSLVCAKLSKEALKHAKVIAQVDKKFLLILVNTTSQVDLKKEEHSEPQRLLVLVDQHAADERIRVETLQADLCKRAMSSDGTNPATLSQNSAVETSLLTKPIIFRIEEKECELFKSQASHFANWGILYSLSISQAESRLTEHKECKVIVKNLPETIAERCRVCPRTLIDLMREEIWKRQGLGSKSYLNSDSSNPAAEDKTTAHSNPPIPPPTQNNDWLQRIGDCPCGILDMLNSRSCRSAIMFNDALTVDECQTLVRRLSACAFPFQCAHGRPSMTPLVQLGGSELSGLSCGKASLGMISGFMGGGDEGRDFGRAWRDWRLGVGESGL